MTIFKAGDQVLVIKDESLLEQYTDKIVSGRVGRVLSSETRDDHFGYYVEIITGRAFTHIHFVRADHLVPDNTRRLAVHEPAWLKTAKEWQNKLWKKHAE